MWPSPKHVWPSIHGVVVKQKWLKSLVMPFVASTFLLFKKSLYCMHMFIWSCLFVVYKIIIKAFHSFNSNRVCRAFGIALVFVVLVSSFEKVSLSHSDIYTYEKWIDDKCLVM